MISRFYVGFVHIGSDWGSVEALVFFFSLLLLAEVDSSATILFNAFEVKKDLFWSKVLLGFSYKTISTSFLYLTLELL